LVLVLPPMGDVLGRYPVSPNEPGLAPLSKDTLEELGSGKWFLPLLLLSGWLGLLGLLGFWLLFW